MPVIFSSVRFLPYFIIQNTFFLPRSRKANELPNNWIKNMMRSGNRNRNEEEDEEEKRQQPPPPPVQGMVFTPVRMAEYF